MCSDCSISTKGCKDAFSTGVSAAGAQKIRIRLEMSQEGSNLFIT